MTFQVKNQKKKVVLFLDFSHGITKVANLLKLHSDLLTIQINFTIKPSYIFINLLLKSVGFLPAKEDYWELKMDEIILHIERNMNLKDFVLNFSPVPQCHRRRWMFSHKKFKEWASWKPKIMTRHILLGIKKNDSKITAHSKIFIFFSNIVHRKKKKKL